MPNVRIHFGTHDICTKTVLTVYSNSLMASLNGRETLRTISTQGGSQISSHNPPSRRLQVSVMQVITFEF